MDQELKQKLIGAAVITALAAIFVPMLFDEPAEIETPVMRELTIPEPPVTVFEQPPSPIEPGLSAAAETPTPANEQAAAPAADTPDDLDLTEAEQAIEPEWNETAPEPETKNTQITGLAPPPPPPKVKPEKPAAAAPKPETKAPVSTQSLTDSWLLQVASFTDRAYADRLLTKLKQAGYAAMIDQSGRIYRVKVGPIASAGQARQLKTEIDRLTRTDGMIISPTRTGAKAEKTPASAPADSNPPGNLVRWYLQLGSFSNQDSANQLRDQLRQQGFPAQIEPVGTGSERMFRLRIGPELDKNRARAMLETIQQKNRLNGFLVSD